MHHSIERLRRNFKFREIGIFAILSQRGSIPRAIHLSLLALRDGTDGTAKPPLVWIMSCCKVSSHRSPAARGREDHSEMVQKRNWLSAVTYLLWLISF
jgi:hypothetical protein